MIVVFLSKILATYSAGCSQSRSKQGADTIFAPIPCSARIAAAFTQSETSLPLAINVIFASFAELKRYAPLLTSPNSPFASGSSPWRLSTNALGAFKFSAACQLAAFSLPSAGRKV